MENSKSTKRAWLTSALSVLACVAMLIGTTFAWFTDTAKTNVNKIQSGTLDVALEMLTKNEAGEDVWVNAENQTLDFKKAEGGAGEKILWEPGCTYELPKLRVVNNGNLALKYKVQITGIKGDAELNKVIDWTIGDVALGTEQHLLPEASNEFTIKGHMQETAGNTYQNKSIDGIAITVVATQDTVEHDSNGNQYDKDAEYPLAVTGDVKTDAETVLKDQPDDHNVMLTVPTGAVDSSVTSLLLTVEKASKPGSITVSNTKDSTTYEVTLKDQSGSKVTAASGKLFKVELKVGTGLEGVALYHNGTAMTKDDAQEADHYTYDAATGFVTMWVDKFSPFTAVFIKSDWSKHAADVYSVPVDQTDKVVTITNAKELALFANEVTTKGVNYSNYTVNITADVDLDGYLWTPIKGNGKMRGITINGNNHAIRNMLARGCTNSSGYGAGFIGDTDGAITIKNITFDNADVFFLNYVAPQCFGNIGGIVMGYTYGTTLFENVTVTNSKIAGYGKIGILLGMGADPGVKVTFKNCVSRNNTLNAAYDIGGLAGMIQRGNGVDNASVENCIVENITVNYYNQGAYVDVKGTATFKSNDQPSGTEYTREINSKYLDESGYYWCGYADYYVSYGHSSYDAPVEGYTKALANSEYVVNK